MASTQAPSPTPRQRLGSPGLAALAVIALLGLALGGCSKVIKLHEEFPRLFAGTLHVKVDVADDLNNDSPVAVEVVIAYDPSTFDSLKVMSASQWFAGREQFLKDHPGQVDHRLWEWVPGQLVPEQEIPYRIGAYQAVVFAGYASAGDHRQVVDPHQALSLYLGPTELVIETGS